MRHAYNILRVTFAAFLFILAVAFALACFSNPAAMRAALKGDAAAYIRSHPAK